MDDGLDVFAGTCRELGVSVPQLIVKSARWVHPDTFRYLPVWYPELYRRAPLYDKYWTKRRTNTSRATNRTVDKSEGNEKASITLLRALGASRRSKNWTCCHIWGVDDPKFQKVNSVVKDPRYYSCVGNMLLLPTPAKAFTDSMPEIKSMLRVCAWNLYGWVCEHEEVAEEAKRIRAGWVPEGYPSEWPLPDRKALPPGTAQFTQAVKRFADRRLTEIRSALNDETLTHYPQQQVRTVCRHWRIAL